MLSEKALLVSLNISLWSARRHDKQASYEVSQSHNASLNAGRYNKRLISHASYKEIVSKASEVRLFHYQNTLPWAQDGARILPTNNYMPYVEGLRKYREGFSDAVEYFVSLYNTAKEQARNELGSLYNELDYPNDIRNKFNINVNMYPVPDAEDFRIKLNEDEIERIKGDLKAQATQALADSMRDVWERLYQCIKHITEKLADSEAIFRNSLIGNLKNLCEVLPRLNILNDSNLALILNDIQNNLALYEPDDLRKDKTLRSEAHKEAQRIENLMRGYMPNG